MLKFTEINNICLSYTKILIHKIVIEINYTMLYKLIEFMLSISVTYQF